jgi:hypothetical protein
MAADDKAHKSDKHKSHKSDKHKSDKREHKSDKHAHKSDKREHKSDKHGKRERSPDGGDSKRHRRDDEQAKDDADVDEWPTPAAPPPGGIVLRASDYYTRANEFRVWLLEEQRIYSDELPTEKARQLFRLFGTLWNGSKLPPKFYQPGGLPETQMAAASRTRHKWAFAAKMSEADQLTLQSAKDHVDTLTHRDHDQVR